MFLVKFAMASPTGIFVLGEAASLTETDGEDVLGHFSLLSNTIFFLFYFGHFETFHLTRTTQESMKQN